MIGAALRTVGSIIAFAIAACSGPVIESTAPVAPADEEINLDVWLERLEVGSRELYSAREAVVAAVGLERGDWVADIGSGTGLYSLLFSNVVGPQGRVFAEDIEPLFLDLVIRRAADNGANNITAVLGREEDVMLPANTMDVAFIADTYHYFGQREEIMRTIHAALKPGGALVMVEYNIDPNGKVPDHKSHVRFGKQAVISEIKFIGFEFVEEVEVEGLKDTYFVRFIKPTAATD